MPEFVPTVRFEEGVRRVIAHVLAHPELQTEDSEFDAWCDNVIAVQEEAKAKLRMK